MILTPARTPSWRLKAGAGAALFLCFFGLYLAGHSASIYLDDSGETVTDAAVLGVAHPPGYPLHTLIARTALGLASRLGGLGGPAEPVTLLAALFGALCVSAVFLGLTAGRPWPGPAAPGGPPPPGAQGPDLNRDWCTALLVCGLPAALLGLGPVFWHNALTAKGGIYQLNNFFSAVLLGLLAAPGPKSPRRLRAFWLLFGAALAHHYMSQLPLLPAYAWLLRPGAGPDRGGRKPWRDAWLALPGVALYLYLPLRSAQNPDLNWGGIRGLRDFLFFFFRLQYAATDISRSAATSWSEARYALHLLLLEGGYVLLPLGLAGFWLGRRERAPQAYALGWTATLAACAFYMNLKPERLTLLHPYLFPAYLCQALLSGRALAALGARPLRAWGRRCALAGACLACLALCWESWPGVDLSDYYFAVDGARGLLSTLPRNALLLCNGDAVVFPLWYAQRVLHERDDVAVVGLAVLPMEWVRRDVTRRWPDVSEPMPDHPLGAESVAALARATLDLNPQRPAYATFDRFQPDVPTWKLVPQGPDYLCVSAAFTPPPSPQAADAQRHDAWARLATEPIRGFTRRPLDADTLEYLVGDLGVRYNELGVQAENAGAFSEALAFYSQAARIKPEDPNYPFNMGNAYAELGDLASSVEAFGRSVEADPGYVNGWYNRGVILMKLKRMAEAKASLERALILDPSRADIRQALRQPGFNQMEP